MEGAPSEATGSGRTAFVAGATGYTGQATVRQAVAVGLRTVAHVRPDSPRLDEWRETLRGWGAEVDVTPWELEAMGARLKGLAPDVVFALLGTTRARQKRTRRSTGVDAGYDSVDYGLTSLLLKASRRVVPPPRFVYLSAAGVEAAPNSAYYRARRKVEAELRAADVPFVIARPSFITGPDRQESRPGERIGAAVADAALGALALVGGRRLAERYRSTTASELARALVRAAVAPDALGVTLEAEDLRRLASASGG